MTAVWVLRELWTRRLLVAVGLAIAVMAGILIAFSVKPGLPPQFDGRQYKVGIASAGVLVDSPSSLSVDLSGGQSKADVASLSARARLLANLMATSPMKEQIARRAGVPPDRMIATAPTVGPAGGASPLTTGATKVKPTDPDANILTVYVNEVLPIITVDTQAPHPQAAARISSAAVEQLTTYLKSVAATDRVPDAQQLVVKPLGPAKSAIVQRGPRRLFAIVGLVFVFGLWCAGIVMIAALARSWRDADAAESIVAQHVPPPMPEPRPTSDGARREPDSTAYPGGASSARPRAVVPEDPPELPERPFRAA